MAKAKVAEKGQAEPAPDPPPTEFDPQTGVRSTVLHFDDAGYPGWWAKARVNAKTRDWEAVLSKEPAHVWQGMAAVVLAWNFVDGGPMPLPSEGLAIEDFPRDLVVPLVTNYINAVIAVAAAPKG